MKHIKIMPIILFLFALLNCTTSSIVITGDVRPPITSAEVKIFLDAPQEYETIALIEASVDVGFSKQKAQDRVIEKLKTEAAKLGANGVILKNMGTKSGGNVGFSADGIYFGSGNDTKIVQAIAIFFISKLEKPELEDSEEKDSE